jgi:hypothetical protein
LWDKKKSNFRGLIRVVVVVIARPEIERGNWMGGGDEFTIGEYIGVTGE